jgi:hypothetical protein
MSDPDTIDRDTVTTSSTLLAAWVGRVGLLAVDIDVDAAGQAKPTHFRNADVERRLLVGPIASWITRNNVERLCRVRLPPSGPSADTLGTSMNYLRRGDA